MEYLRSEYVEVIDRWNELSTKRDVLLEQLHIFEDTRGDLPQSVGEQAIRRQLAEILDESLQVAHRGAQLAEIRELFPKLRGRRAQLRTQQHWFHNIKELRQRRIAL